MSTKIYDAYRVINHKVPDLFLEVQNFKESNITTARVKAIEYMCFLSINDWSKFVDMHKKEHNSSL